MALKRGWARLIIRYRPRHSTGIATRNTAASRAFRRIAIISAPIIIIGARNTMRIIMLKAFCTLFTSVVRRVTSDAVENLSMLEKEKDCTFSNSARRTLLAKPIEALAPRRAPSEPKHSDTIAISIISRPIHTV